MKLPRRQFLHLAAGAAALPAVSRIAWAESFPTRPVRIIVGFPAGGGADIGARLIGQWLSERLGQQFIVENRPGAGGSVAAEAVAHAPADGYALLVVGACATPEALEKPPNTPTMVRSTDPNPLPAAVAPGANAGNKPDCDLSDAPQCH